MRTLLAGERATTQGARNHTTLKLEVQNASGTWKDLGALLGDDYVVDARWGEALDTPVASATFTLRRRAGLHSLAPLIVASALNVDDTGAYAPLLEMGRGVRLSTATLPAGVAPASGDWREAFVGRIDKVNDASDPVVLDCSDLGAWLMDTQIEVDAVEYGSAPTGIAMETVIQNIVTAWPSGKGTPTLVKQSANTFMVTKWTQGRTKVLEAIRDLALQSTGEDVRFRYDSSGVSRLTLFDPQRTRTTIDATFAGTEYRAVPLSERSIADIRNAGLVPYVDAAGVLHTAPSSDAVSIAAYGRRYFELPESDSITTSTDANALIAKVVSDLASAPLDHAIETGYVWFVQLYDRHTLLANGDHYDQDQTLGVIGYQHAASEGAAFTTITYRDRVVGAYADWKKRLQITPADASDVYLTDLRQTAGDPTTTISFVRSPDVAEVWGAFAVFTAPETAADWNTVVAALAPLPSGATTFDVTSPADQQVTLLQLVPYRADGTPGTVIRRVLYGLPQVPTWQYDDLEVGSVGTQWLGLLERGIAVTSVEAQSQVASGAFTSFAAPTRGPGATSVVKGGTLGANEYEQDVPLSTVKGRQSFIRFQWTLANGTTVTSPDFAFDADRNPNIVSITHVGSLFTITGDSDTKSVLIGSINRAWYTYLDGQFLTADLAALDPQGNAGLGANATDTFLVRVFNEPIAEVGTGFGTIPPSTSAEYQDQQVTFYNGTGTGGTSGSPLATWLQVTAAAPSIGHNLMQLSLKASAAPSGWTVKVFLSDPDTSPAANVTASLSPALSAPPTSLTNYTIATELRTGSGGDSTLITITGWAQLLNGSGVVQDSRSFTVSYYA